MKLTVNFALIIVLFLIASFQCPAAADEHNSKTTKAARAIYEKSSYHHDMTNAQYPAVAAMVLLADTLNEKCKSQCEVYWFGIPKNIPKCYDGCHRMFLP